MLFFQYIYNKFFGLINKSHISHNASLGSNIYLEGCNLISNGCSIDKCYFGYSSYIGKNTCLYNVKIGKYTSIGPNVINVVGRHPTKKYVSTHPAFFSVQKQVGYTYVDKQEFNEFGFANSTNNAVAIGNDVWIGANAIILDGITIGDGAIIGAGCVVNKDVKPYEICVGNPMRVVRKRFSDEMIEKLLYIKWWDRESTWLKSNASLFKNVELFLEHYDKKN
jgi:acetyltransferase-like isoleucine patch superfamily enzyme